MKEGSIKRRPHKSDQRVCRESVSEEGWEDEKGAVLDRAQTENGERSSRSTPHSIISSPTPSRGTDGGRVD